MDVIASLKWLFNLFQIFGILPFSLKKTNGGFAFTESKSRFLYTKVTFGLYFLAQIYLIWFAVVVNVSFVSENSLRTVMLMSTFGSTTSNLAIFRGLFIESKLFYKWLNKINGMFSILKKTQLKKVQTYSSSFVIITGAYLISLGFCELYLRHLYEKKYHTKTFFHKPYLMIPSYYATMWEIKLFMQLFLVLINLMRSYYEVIHQTLRNGKKKLDKEFWLRYVHKTRLKDLELIDFLDFLHSFFVPVASLQLLWGFSTLLFNLTTAARVGIPSVIQFVWMIYIVSDMFIIIMACHLAEKESGKTLHYLHELFIDWDDKQLRNEIEIFSLQVQHKKVEFNALGFHKVNFSLVYSMIGSLTSTAVILLQFQNEPYFLKEYCIKIIKNSSSDILTEMNILHSPLPDANFT